jgi:Tol biopolymer transport system component
LGPYLFEVASRRTRRLTDHPALDFNAAFATDGRSLAFISTRDGNHELYTTTEGVPSVVEMWGGSP